MEDSESAKSTRPKGGLRTMPFIIGKISIFTIFIYLLISPKRKKSLAFRLHWWNFFMSVANEAFEKRASYGLQPNMILYLTNVYHYSAASGTSVLFIWGAISNFMPILGAFLSDSFFGRFLVISVATIITLTGLILLWLTSIIQDARSPHCNPPTNICVTPKPGQIALLFAAFALMSIGSGGIRPCSIAFGADQFDNPSNPKNPRVLQSFFNWYYASLGISLMIAVTVIVYIQTEYGWIIGFGVPVGLMFLSAVMFFLGSRLYVKVKPESSLLTGLVQVSVAYWKKRDIVLLSHEEEIYYYDKGSKVVAPTDELRFLNKACIIRNSEKDLKPDGSPYDPWTLCSVLQVEVLKSLINLLPMWSTGIVIAVTISQHTFPVLQANTLNRHLIGSFEIPAGSFGLFGILTLTIWVALYDRIIVPCLSKFKMTRRGIPVITRIGIGLFISCLATGVAAVVERTRRARAIHEGLAETPHAEVNMSAMWLIPQHCLTGLAEALNAIGQIELYYSQFPKSMASIAVALFALSMAIANLIGALIVNIVAATSKRGGRESWVSSNLNKGHYDYYYWILTIMSVVNFFYFVFCSRYCKGFEREKVWDEDVGGEEGKIGGVVMVKSMESTPSVYFSA